MSITAAILLFDGFGPLDAVAPYEVLAAGSVVLGGALQVDLVAAPGPGHVRSGTGDLTLVATGTFDPDRPGHVIVPGASGPLDDDLDTSIESIPARLGRLVAGPAGPLLRRAMENPSVTVWTVCGGSLALAMAGLLDDRHVTTHTFALGRLDGTGARPVKARLVDDGDLVSAGGVTSGLDLGLYLLEREFGPDVAHAVEGLFEYERRGTVWRAPGSFAPRTAQVTGLTE